MRRIALLTGLALAAVLVVALVVTQLVLPGYVDRRAEHRLTTDGGTASVHVSAFPAVRLLRAEGSSVKVRANGINAALAAPGDEALGNLEGFDRVDVRATNLRSGPFAVRSFTLARPSSDKPYTSTVRATVSAADLSTFAGSALGGSLGGFIGALAGGSLPFGTQPIPIDVEAQLERVDGRTRATSVRGSVAGVPAGPLIEALAVAFGNRL